MFALTWSKLRKMIIIAKGLKGTKFVIFLFKVKTTTLRKLGDQIHLSLNEFNTEIVRGYFLFFW